MGINFRKGAKADAVGGIRPKPDDVGRERLRHFDQELAKAHTFVADMETRVARLATIITDAVAAEQALQLYIASDGGVAALAAHSAGQTTPDDEISDLIAEGET
jgi:hypothetical protein